MSHLRAVFISILILLIPLQLICKNTSPNSFLLGRVRMLPHGPQRLLEQIVHTLYRSALHLRQAKVDEDNATVGKHGVQQEYAPAHLGDHVGGGSGDAVVDDPVDEETD